MSGLFASAGAFIVYYILKNTKNYRLAIGVSWFVVMEALQFFQYMFIDDCDSRVNQALTLFGFFHITMQPMFCHILNSGLTSSPRIRGIWDSIIKLCFLGGLLYFGRYFIADWSSAPISSDFTDWVKAEPLVGSYRTPEWIRGEKLCTFRGKYHLAWSVPLYEPTYYSPSGAIHSFLMFAPFFTVKSNAWIQGVFLFVTGPLLASFITPNLQEQASIWCFFSIAQIGVMLFLIREQLLLGPSRKRASKGGDANGTRSLLASTTKSKGQ